MAEAKFTPLVCELCGSNDIVKETELFVCQHCGTKYSLEAARRMMFGDAVQVTVDNSAQIGNLLTRAWSFAAEQNWPRTLEYFDRVLDLDPQNAEANAALNKLKARAAGPNVQIVMSAFGATFLDIFIDGRNIGFLRRESMIGARQDLEVHLDPGPHTVSYEDTKMHDICILTIGSPYDRHVLKIGKSAFSDPTCELSTYSYALERE